MFALQEIKTYAFASQSLDGEEMKCSIPECDEKLKPGSKSKICSLCRGNIAYWSRRQPSDFLGRVSRLRKYTYRMTEVQSRGPNANRRIQKIKAKAAKRKAKAIVRETRNRVLEASATVH
jgi:hypothetical protein